MLRPVSHTVRSISLLVFTGALIVCGACTTRTFVERPHRVSLSNTHRIVNVNTADKTQLQSLPNIGPALADRIIEHRARYGPFRRVDHLLLIEGISEKRFREISTLITSD